jgi:2-alkyl-3-oxoalkanoate reductase
MKVLVTGANGFIGSFLCPALIGAGHDVTGLAMPDEDSSRNEDIGVATIRADLRNRDSLIGICEGQQLVYHLAGRVADWGTRRAFYSSIVDATRNLLDEAAGNVERFVYISSVCALGMGKDLFGAKEDDPVFRSGVPYADAKADAEKLCWERHGKDGLAVTVVRPTNVTGPGSVWVNDIMDRLINGSLPVFDHGRNNASLIYVANLVDGLLLAGTKDVAAGRTYHFRDDWDVTWKKYLDDLATFACTKTSFSIPFKVIWPAAFVLEKTLTPLGFRPTATRHTVGLMGRDLRIDNTRAKEELGWKTRVSYEDAMREIHLWLCESELSEHVALDWVP